MLQREIGCRHWWMASALTLLMAVALARSATINETADSVTQHVIKEQPIVVHTPLQNYEQPTLAEYEECHRNRDQCVIVCADSESCLAKCPLCPELHEQPIVVQGVNDTDYSPSVAVPLNTTNIIRLTNEINNIIQNDIQARNVNNVQVQQNVSQVGGRFGLGYNEQGASCCHVVRRARNCEHQERGQCPEESRQRVCGERCQARVMLARRVVQCSDEEQSTDCHETIEYVPARRRKGNKGKKQQRCRYQGNVWPYVSCDGQRTKRATCRRCLELPYVMVLQHGVPAQCAGCFQGFAAPLMPMMYVPYGYVAPAWQDNGFWDGAPETEPEPKPEQDADNGWVLESQKCVQPDGTMVNCTGDYVAQPPPKDQNDTEVEESKDDKDESFDYESGYDVPAQRRRRRQSRRQFLRSAYSHRNN